MPYNILVKLNITRSIKYKQYGNYKEKREQQLSCIIVPSRTSPQSSDAPQVSHLKKLEDGAGSSVSLAFPIVSWCQSQDWPRLGMPLLLEKMLRKHIA